MIKSICINILLRFISSLASLYLLASGFPVSQAVSILRRKQPGISRVSQKDLMLPSAPWVIQTQTTSEHQIFMRVLFPTSSHINNNMHKQRVSFIRRGTLSSKYNYLLSIYADGSVGGSSRRNSKYVKLEFHSVDRGLLMILGVATNRYLTITDDGHLIGQSQPSLNSVLKEEYMVNMYQAFESYKFQSKKWYVGLKRNGKAKRAQDTKIGQKATQFMIHYDDSI